MFAYIDPSIRRVLVQRERLLRIDGLGRSIPVDEAASAAGDLTLNVLGPVPLPVEVSTGSVTFEWWSFVRHTELAKAEEIAQAIQSGPDRHLLPLLASYMSVNSALVIGDAKAAEQPLVRVHSSCLAGDVFGSQRCECGPQLGAALDRISQSPSGGILVYMSGHEGRGIGLWAKAITYVLQDAGQDTYQANRSLGLPDDSRDFSDAAAILLFLLGGDRPFRLLSNNPKKRRDLEVRGLTHISPEKHLYGVSAWNRRYLGAKQRWGHTFDDADVAQAEAAVRRDEPKA